MKWSTVFEQVAARPDSLAEIARLNGTTPEEIRAQVQLQTTCAGANVDAARRAKEALSRYKPESDAESEERKKLQEEIRKQIEDKAKEKAEDAAKEAWEKQQEKLRQQQEQAQRQQQAQQQERARQQQEQAQRQQQAQQQERARQQQEQAQRQQQAQQQERARQQQEQARQQELQQQRLKQAREQAGQQERARQQQEAEFRKQQKQAQQRAQQAEARRGCSKYLKSTLYGIALTLALIVLGYIAKKAFPDTFGGSDIAPLAGTTAAPAATPTCAPLVPERRKCPWSPEGYTVEPCSPGFCYDAGPQGTLSCKQEVSPENSWRDYYSNVQCNDGYTPQYDPCTGVVLQCVMQ